MFTVCAEPPLSCRPHCKPLGLGCGIPDDAQDARPQTPANKPRQLIPLVLLAIVLGGLAVVGYYIYQSVVEIRGAAEERMSRRNINFSKEGMRVGVRNIGNESYVDKTQRWVVKAWELSGNAVAGEGASGGNGANGDHQAKKRYGSPAEVPREGYPWDSLLCWLWLANEERGVGVGRRNRRAARGIRTDDHDV